MCWNVKSPSSLPVSDFVGHIDVIFSTVKSILSKLLVAIHLRLCQLSKDFFDYSDWYQYSIFLQPWMSSGPTIPSRSHVDWELWKLNSTYLEDILVEKAALHCVVNYCRTQGTIWRCVHTNVPIYKYHWNKLRLSFIHINLLYNLFYFNPLSFKLIVLFCWSWTA